MIRSSDIEILTAKNNFNIFCQHILNQKIGAVHREWINAIEAPHINTCVVAPRGHFKTSILSVAYPLWRLFKSDTPMTATIFSASLGQSTEIMGKIKNIIETNDVINYFLMPKSASAKWSETKITTEGNHRILCIPFGDAIRGFHPDLSICDDVQKVEESTNAEYVKEVFYGIIYPITQAKNGKHVVVGTPSSYLDLLHDLETKEDFKTLKYSAIKSDGNPLFPEHYSLEQLTRIKNTLPAHLWAREYMCQPISSSTSLFPFDTLIRPALELKVDPTPDQQKMALKYLGCDIAVSEEGGSDYSAFVEVTKYPDLPMEAKIMFHKRGITTTQQQKLIKELHTVNKYNKVIVEQVGISYSMVVELQQDDQMRSFVEEFKTSNSLKEQALSRLEITLRNNNLKLPKDDELLTELMQFGIKLNRGKQTFESLGKHDDIVMALAMAVNAATQTTVPVSCVIV